MKGDILVELASVSYTRTPPSRGSQSNYYVTDERNNERSVLKFDWFFPFDRLFEDGETFICLG